MNINNEIIEQSKNNYGITDFFYGLYALTLARWFNPRVYVTAHQVMEYLKTENNDNV